MIYSLSSLSHLVNIDWFIHSVWHFQALAPSLLFISQHTQQAGETPVHVFFCSCIQLFLQAWRKTSWEQLRRVKSRQTLRSGQVWAAPCPTLPSQHPHLPPHPPWLPKLPGQRGIFMFAQKKASNYQATPLHTASHASKVSESAEVSGSWNPCCQEGGVAREQDLLLDGRDAKTEAWIGLLWELTE